MAVAVGKFPICLKKHGLARSYSAIALQRVCGRLPKVLIREFNRARSRSMSEKIMMVRVVRMMAVLGGV
jgi:hypothetical protein